LTPNSRLQFNASVACNVETQSIKEWSVGTTSKYQLTPNLVFEFVFVMADTHSEIKPAILYWGTPVVLISTENEDGTANIGPMSSAFWLGDRCILGLDASSQTPKNLLRTGQCVLNLPSDDMTRAVNKLAKTTGTKELPAPKLNRGYTYEKDKFGVAGLTPEPSSKCSPGYYAMLMQLLIRDTPILELVRAPRIAECPVQMEAELVNQHPIIGGAILVMEVKIVKTLVTDNLRLSGHDDRIDPDAWKPMFMMFQHLYGLRPGKIEQSKLASIDEELYRALSKQGTIDEELYRAVSREAVPAPGSGPLGTDLSG
jgi:flavin reductase (DIM6/NTAB) family NADH-FMN oxidoreductase RutF